MAENMIVEMRKIYISDLSVEVPHAPSVFNEHLGQGPEVSLGIGKEIHSLEEENFYEVKLKFTVTAKTDEKVIYLIEVAQCAIIIIAGLDEEDRDNVLNIGVPSMMFPYAAETCNNAIHRAGFPPLFLKPINFEMLYQQELAQRAQAGESETLQ